MKTALFCLVSCIVLTTGCSQERESTTHETGGIPHAEKEGLKNVKVENTKDLVCRMPLSEGIGDTTYYNGKIYGFCSKSCKNKFVKSPMAYVGNQ